MHVHLPEADFGKLRIWRPKELLYRYGAPDWSEIERKYVWLQANPVELTGFCTVKALNYTNDSKQIEWDLAGSLQSSEHNLLGVN
jgi:hypothetical protein